MSGYREETSQPLSAIGATDLSGQVLASPMLRQRPVLDIKSLGGDSSPAPRQTSLQYENKLEFLENFLTSSSSLRNVQSSSCIRYRGWDSL